MPGGMKPNFETFAAKVLKRKSLRSLKTYQAARAPINRLAEFFKGIPIHQVTDDDWMRYCIWRREQVPTARLFDDRKHLKTILKAAKVSGVISNAPELTVIDKKRVTGREIQPEELERLFKHASPILAFQMEIALKMGFRLREMLRLRWDQFDWERKLIRLGAADTKTRKGRVVPINPDLLQRFTERRACTEFYSKWVFPRRSDVTKPQENNRRAWERIKGLAGVTCRWHDLRHTCATRMRRRGVQEGTTSKVLGMSRKVLSEIYDHLSEDDLADVARKMSDGSFKSQPD